MRIRAITTLTAAALLALTACSSSDDADKADASPTTTPTNTPAAEPKEDEALRTAVEAYTAAYFKGDADEAYGTLSKRCKGKITPEAYGPVVEQAAKDYGTDHPATDVAPDVSGDLARVTYTVKGLPKFDQEAQPWAREGGAWKYDAC